MAGNGGKVSVFWIEEYRMFSAFTVHYAAFIS
jgi:hypothetical protein